MEGKVPRAMRHTGVIVVWAVIFLCAMLLLLNEYFFRAKFWRASVLQNAIITASRIKRTKRITNPPKLIELVMGKMLMFVWMPYLVIALLAIWLRNPPFRKRTKDDEFDATAYATTAEPSGLRTVSQQIKRFFLYQMPPRRFWAFLLSGGFNITDLIVVVLWCSVNAVWLYLGFDTRWKGNYLAKFHKTGQWKFGSRTADMMDAFGYGSAWAALYNLVFLFMPVARNSFLHYLFNSDFSELIKYHRWLGHGTLWMTLVHGIAYYIHWFSRGLATFRHDAFWWQWNDTYNYLAGSIAFFPFGLVLWITTIPYIRRHFFKLFLTSHIIGFLGFMFFTYVHYPPSFWYVPGLLLYFLDVTFRISQLGVTSGVQCSFVSAKRTFVTLRLKFNKAAVVRPTQFLFVNMPSVSRFDWHPISVSDVYPGSDGVSQDVTLHMKAYGSWTKEVVRQLAQQGTIPVRADGPYGAVHVHPSAYSDCNTVILVAGGIGITPFLGMLRELRALHEMRFAKQHKDLSDDGFVDRFPSSVHLVWVVRDRDELQLLDAELLAAAALPGSWLQLDLFYTRESNSPAAQTSEATALSPLDVTLTSGAGKQHIVRQLQPYGFGDFHWALAHVLAMVGAFFAGVMVQAYFVEGKITSKRGPPIWGVGMLYALATVVGSMGLPALIIFPLQMYRYRRHVKACIAAHQQTVPESARELKSGAEGKSIISKNQVECLLPNDKASSGPLDLESGKAATVSFGRPALFRLITSMVAGHSTDEHIGIIASGPPSLVVDARLATSSATKGMKSSPELTFHSHSFTF